MIVYPYTTTGSLALNGGITVDFVHKCIQTRKLREHKEWYVLERLQSNVPNAKTRYIHSNTAVYRPSWNYGRGQ